MKFKLRCSKNENSVGMTDEEVRQRMWDMYKYIEQDCERRIKLVESEMRSSFEVIMAQYRTFKTAVDRTYAAQEKSILLETLLYTTRQQNLSRLKILEAKDQHVLEVVTKANERIRKVDLPQHRQAYRSVLYGLTVEGLCKLLETEVVARFRKHDVLLGSSILRKSAAKFRSITGYEVSLEADREEFLKEETCGGVILWSKNGRVMVTNTLVQRLDQVLYAAHPLIRGSLWGPNENRKYVDRPDVLVATHGTKLSLRGSL